MTDERKREEKYIDCMKVIQVATKARENGIYTAKENVFVNGLAKNKRLARRRRYKLSFTQIPKEVQRARHSGKEVLL